MKVTKLMKQDAAELLAQHDGHAAEAAAVAQDRAERVLGYASRMPESATTWLNAASHWAHVAVYLHRHA